MKQPYPPFLELSIYEANQDEKKVFLRLIQALLSQGASFTGIGMVHKNVKLNERRSASIYDQPLEVITIHSLDDFNEQLENENIRLVQVWMQGTSGTTSASAEIVSYQSISTKASLRDHHPIAIWTSGDVFSGPLDQTLSQSAREIGLQAYFRFRSLVDAL